MRQRERGNRKNTLPTYCCGQGASSEAIQDTLDLRGQGRVPIA